MSLLQMSISAACMIIVIVLVRAVAMNKLPKKAFIALWVVTLGRLLVPFSIPYKYSFLSFINHISGLFTGNAAPQQGFAQGFFANTTPPDMLGGGAPEGGGSVSISPLLVVWAIGAALCAAVLAISYIRCRREFRTSLPLDNAFINQWQAENSIRRSIRYRVSDKISAPLTYGIFRPVILLPKSTRWDDEQYLQYVLAHEHIHIKHFDALQKLFMGIALCVHWFNPLVWVMFILYNRDMELSCDESVVKKLGDGFKSSYALTLIHMEEQNAQPMPLYSNFSKYAIEERVNAIMKHKKTSVIAVVAAVLLIAGTTTVFAASAETGLPSSTPETEVQSGGQEAIGSTEPSPTYLEHGISYDANGNMLFNNKLVRYFWDGVAIDDDSFATRYEYLNENGTVDVHTVWGRTDIAGGGYDPFGELLDIVEYSQEEFDARDIDALKNPSNPSAATNGGITNVEPDDTPVGDGDATPTAVAENDGTGGNTGGRTFAQIFAQYKDFGIEYKEPTNGGLGNVYYNGQLVKRFVDENNGGTFAFSSSDDGEITVHAVYSENGTLTGVEIVR